MTKRTGALVLLNLGLLGVAFITRGGENEALTPIVKAHGVRAGSSVAASEVPVTVIPVPAPVITMTTMPAQEAGPELPPVTTTTAPGTETPIGAFDQWGPQVDCDAAVAEVDYPLPSGFTVLCTIGEWAASHTDDRTVYLNPGQLPVAQTYAHELGHAWDRAELTDAEQDEWASARGYTAGFTTGEGGPCLYADGCIPPTEDFADCFACALGWCGMAYGTQVPTAEQVALLWSLIS